MTHIKHILFLDGECLFCQKSARRLHRWDRDEHLYFAALQGETASMLPDDWKRLTDTQGQPAGAAVFIENAGHVDERRWQSADAILRAVCLTGGWRSLLWGFHFTPAFLKNGLYRFIARKRHWLSWGNRSCALPHQKFKDKFLP